jgi:pimeloyl-ACP methyl ester carboxylesterase
MLTGQPHTHVVTCDYRGFGLSTGSPTEVGVITDAVSLVDYVLHTLRHPPSRIVLLGQSLGTAVASATTLYFLNPESPLLPSNVTKPSPRSKAVPGPVNFAGTILIASFTNLPSLLLTYRIIGFIPVLSPVRGYPRIQNYLAGSIVDTWDTASRLKAASNAALHAKLPLNLQLLHSRNDPDITFRQSEMLFDGIAATMGVSGIEQAAIEERSTWDEPKNNVRRGAWAYKMTEDDFVDARQKRRVELEIVRQGGHNRIVTQMPVALAVMRTFDAAAKRESP